jgi:hypothetical protein
VVLGGVIASTFSLSIYITPNGESHNIKHLDRLSFLSSMIQIYRKLQAQSVRICCQKGILGSDFRVRWRMWCRLVRYLGLRTGIILMLGNGDGFFVKTSLEILVSARGSEGIPLRSRGSKVCCYYYIFWKSYPCLLVVVRNKN